MAANDWLALNQLTVVEAGVRRRPDLVLFLTMRDALPNASFIGFTGTPIEKDNVSTPAVFGNYIDVHDISQWSRTAPRCRSTTRAVLARIACTTIHLVDHNATETEPQPPLSRTGDPQNAFLPRHGGWANRFAT